MFWKTLSLQWGISAAFTAATFLILYGSFLALKRAHLPDLPSGHTIYIGGQPLKLPVEPVSPETTLRNCGSPHLNISPDFIETHTRIVWHNMSRLFEEQFSPDRCSTREANALNSAS